jgi:hypothetical protein
VPQSDWKLTAEVLVSTAMSNQSIKLPNEVQYEQPVGLFIDNEFVSASGEEFEVVDPASAQL